MTLCLITSVFTPYTRGGAESVVGNIVNGFKNTPHQIFVITICPFKKISDLWPHKFIENNLTIYRFYPLNLFSYLNINKYKKFPGWRLLWHFLDVFNWHSYWVIKHILKKEKPDVVMTHVLKGIGYLTCRAIKKCQIKNIHTLHDVQLATPSGLILKGEENSWQHKFFLTKIYQAINRRLFAAPQIVISSSKFLLDFYSQRGFFPHSKKVILTNPIAIQTAFRQVDRPEGRENFTFLFLGQIEKYKGILLLIKVFKKLLQESKKIPLLLKESLPAGEAGLGEVTHFKSPPFEARTCQWQVQAGGDPAPAGEDGVVTNIQLLIVGNGSALAEAKKLAGDVETRFIASQSIKFLGYIPNNQLDKIFSQTNATIVPSLCYENSPTVIFESLSYGVPVLAARIGGIEFIHDNFNGFTFEAGDEADLLKILKFSLANKKQLAAMSTNCLESVKEIGVGEYIQKLEEIM